MSLAIEKKYHAASAEFLSFHALLEIFIVCNDFLSGLAIASMKYTHSVTMAYNDFLNILSHLCYLKIIISLRATFSMSYLVILGIEILEI